MKIGVNCGHTLCGAGSGAEGLFQESEHTRLVGYDLMEKLRGAGVDVVDCTIDKADTRQEYLSKITALANREELDWFISIHFNASSSHKGQGVEIYTYKGKQYPEAEAVCEKMERLGFINRGVKQGNGLYVIRKTKAKAMLIEVCFCDNQQDVDIYYHAGAAKAVSQIIFNCIYGQGGNEKSAGKAQEKTEKQASFIELVGTIARKDWKERRIMLPSVVIAQAIKESAWGTSELARKANALFGIKENGWKGRVYIKEAIEQRPDGSYYRVDDTRWRSYDDWEQSILDHNNYIATRSTDGGKSLRYGPVIGCGDPELVCWYLQRCGYATSITYAESLLNDYLVKYDLTTYDGMYM